MAYQLLKPGYCTKNSYVLYQSLAKSINFNYLNYRWLCLLLVGHIWLLFSSENAFATHLRAGEITTVRDPTDPLKFKVTLTLYTDKKSPVTQPEAVINFGDGTSETVQRTSYSLVSALADSTGINYYVTYHTYNAPGAYLIYFTGDNRNSNVVNMTNSNQQNFYIESLVTVDPLLGINSSPILLHLPLDQGIVGQPYLHNPAAFDADGDSITYKLIPSRQWINNRPTDVDGFVKLEEVQFGNGHCQNSALTGNSTAEIGTDGTLKWDAPCKVGYYNVAIQMTELRNINGYWVVIGHLVRDMQIIISDSRNRKPVLVIPKDTCIVATKLLTGAVTAKDPDVNDKINIYAYSNFTNPPDNYSFIAKNPQAQGLYPEPNGQFKWTPKCSDIRDRPYNITFVASDVPVFLPIQSDTKIWNIKVYGPPPQGLKAKALNNGVNLTWTPYNSGICTNADTIAIYRRVDTINFSPLGCDYGDPEKLGYTRIASVPASQSSYRDSGRIFRGNLYSYRIMAFFPKPKGGRSYISAPDTASFNLELPIILKVSVLKTDSLNGSNRVWWSKPLQPDTNKYPKPYGYRVYRNPFNDPTKKIIVKTTFLENDTTLIDTGFNTLTGNRWNYLVSLVFGKNRDTIPSDQGLSTALFTQAQTKGIDLKWVYRNSVGKTGRKHFVYREVASSFELIDSVSVQSDTARYSDLGTYNNIPLKTGRFYRYFVNVNGKFTNKRLKILTSDSSQIAWGQKLDTIIPCYPGSNGALPTADPTPCNSCEETRNNMPLFNTLRWHPDPLGCDSDVVHYNIYYAPHDDDTLYLVGHTTDSVYLHNNNGSLAGCYQVTAVDFYGNESQRSPKICKDNCFYFKLPNIISPNGDEWNQFFKPFCLIREFVESVDVKIYNRWGGLVYHSDSEIQINWPGIDDSGKALPSATYFYLVTVNYKRLHRSDEQFRLKGWVQVER